MNKTFQNALLNNLALKTLAHMVVDLETAQEDWQFYPEDAPSQAVQEELAQLLKLILEFGQNRVQANKLDFKTLLEQIRDAQEEEDWLKDRGQQEQQNWLKDYE